ncbi:MAG: DUF1847 domain-containing protein [Bacteroidetes bacterium]|nr:DUF1847 domain-containing protein [Bacteroidota bacterium]
MNCIKCNTKSCRTTEPCHAQKFDAKEILRTYHLPENMKIVQAAARLVDQGRAGTLSRLQEVIEFSKTMDFQRIGIAYCFGMEKEAALVTTILRESGFKTFPVSCTTGGFKQSEINSGSTIEKVSCNPLAQAGQLNAESVDFTITVGLCLGHDILFSKYIKSYSTTLIVKDRVHDHHPEAALSLIKELN